VSPLTIKFYSIKRVLNLQSPSQTSTIRLKEPLPCHSILITTVHTQWAHNLPLSLSGTFICISLMTSHVRTCTAVLITKLQAATKSNNCYRNYTNGDNFIGLYLGDEETKTIWTEFSEYTMKAHSHSIALCMEFEYVQYVNKKYL
jgi:hypothetical protein